MNATSRSSADTARPGSDEQDAPASPAPPQGEREAFEAWMRTEHPGVECRVRNALGMYTVSSVNQAWEGFQAGRASLRASTQPAVSAEARIEQPDVHSASGDLLGSYDAGRSE